MHSCGGRSRRRKRPRTRIVKDSAHKRRSPRIITSDPAYQAIISQVSTPAKPEAAATRRIIYARTPQDTALHRSYSFWSRTSVTTG